MQSGGLLGRDKRRSASPDMLPHGFWGYEEGRSRPPRNVRKIALARWTECGILACIPSLELKTFPAWRG